MSKSKKDLNVDTLADFDPLKVALALGLNEKPIASLHSIDDLLSSEDYLIETAQLVAGGASTSTIDMHLGLQPGMVDRWLRLGVRDASGSFRAFYLFYSKAASVARSGAEMALLQKSPDKWLEKIDILGQLNRDPENQSLAAGTGPQVLDPDPSNRLSSPGNDGTQGLTFIDIPE